MNSPLVFVGRYAQADEPGVQVFGYDSATLALAPRGSFTGISNPSFLDLHPRRPYVYVTSETGGAEQESGAVWALRYDTRGGFEALNQQGSGGKGPCHVVLDSSGRWLVASNYSSGSVALLPIAEDGSLGAATSRHQHQGSSVNPDRQTGPHAHSAIFTPDERFVLVADLGLDQVVVYAFDAARGTLTPHGHGSAQPGAGPRHMVFDPTGTLLYVADELDNTVTVFAYDADRGTLEARQVIGTLPADAPVSYVADIHLTPDGSRLLVSNRGHDSLAVFAVAGDGSLALLGTPSCGGHWPRNFAIAPTGDAVLVANERSNTVSSLPLTDAAPFVGASVGDVTVSRASCVRWRTT